MDAKYVAPGRTIDYITTETTQAGTVVVIGDVVGVVVAGAEAGESVAVDIGSVFKVKKGEVAIDAGKAVYWDATDKIANVTDTNKKMGIAVEAAVADDDYVLVKLER